MDTLAMAMNAIKVAETKGKPDARIRPASRVIRTVLSVLQREGYVGEFEFVDDGKSGEFIVKLVGKVNNCGVVKPRFSVKKEEWEKWEQRFLPARNIGMLIVSTPAGVVTHSEARAKGVGGKLLCYVY
ncbi:MAG: 30S ribosomal protein S8 [Candidatus Micrarchaeota archaeon]|nr:30S ribosomal protein S8 [Candidatus Micrarchaeota archaeon]